MPGTSGAPRLVVAHGGEGIGAPGGNVQVIVQDGAVNADRIAVIADGVVQSRTRKMTRGRSRPLPSRGGGSYGTF